MVYCVCGNCDSKNLSLSNGGKYLVCNECGSKEHIKDLDLGFGEINSKEIESKIAKLLIDKFDSIFCDKCNSDGSNCDLCVRKIMGWGISADSAARISKNIIELIRD